MQHRFVVKSLSIKQNEKSSSSKLKIYVCLIIVTIELKEKLIANTKSLEQHLYATNSRIKQAIAQCSI